MWVHTACVCVGLRNVFMIKLDFHSGLFCDTDDTTRVVLKGTDDYINANFINVSIHHLLWLFKSYFVNVLFLENCHLYIFVCLQMEIPGKGEVKRYIACQGPLPGTCSDFWQMMWEQSATLVVMLTTQVERGRVWKYFIEMIHRHKGGKNQHLFIKLSYFNTIKKLCKIQIVQKYIVYMLYISSGQHQQLVILNCNILIIQ